MELVLLCALVALVYFIVQSVKRRRAVTQLTEKAAAQQRQIEQLLEDARAASEPFSEQSSRLQSLEAQLTRYQALVDVEAEVERLSDEIKAEKDSLLKTARQRSEQAEARLSAALLEAERIVATANAKEGLE